MLNNTGFELYLQGLIYRHHELKKSWNDRNDPHVKS